MNRILLFVPAYNCARQLPRVVAQLDTEVVRHLADVVVVDNRSTDRTADVARAALEGLTGVRARLLRNDENLGLGGSHKVAIDLALAEGHSHLLVLHGDDQASVRDVLPLLSKGEHLQTDALLGARFARGATLEGYSALRTAGNHVFNVLFSIVARKRLTDLGSGLNVFSLEAFRRGGFHHRLADDLTFNYYLILAMAHRGWRLRFFPITWREEDQRSNVKMLSQSRRMLRLLAQAVLDREGFDRADHAEPGRRYTSTTLYDSQDRSAGQG